jgi:hypothetical protein
MGKLTRGAWCVVWLLCALIIAARLDRIPDPPAVKSGATDVRSDGFLCPLQAYAGGELSNLSCVPGPRIATRWTALKYICDARLPIAEVALVRQAADPSPPPFARS